MKRKTEKHRHPMLKDLARALPPDAQGRNRYLDENGYIRVGVGIHHPLSCVNGYTTEGRLVLFEAGQLLPGQKVWHRDGNTQNTALGNLVAFDPEGPKPWAQKKYWEPVLCPCGCGQFTPFGRNGRPRKWVAGHKKRQNPFHSLPVTRERKRQLWNMAKGLCCACAKPRNQHGYYCEACRVKKAEASRRRNAHKYAADPDYFSHQSRRWMEKNPERYKDYMVLRAQYGNKRHWPEEIRRFWAEKYPTRLSRILQQVEAGKNPAAVALGHLGGLKGGPARAANLSAEERSEIARNAALSRWNNGHV